MQLKNTIPTISLLQLGSRWQEAIDSAGRHGLSLFSDVNDQLIHIWLSRKDVWHIDTVAYPSQKEAMDGAIKQVNRETIRLAEKLAFFQITSADVRCLLRSTGVFTLRSIDRAIIELALSEILTKHIQSESFANILPFESNKKRDHQPRVVSVCIPYSIKDRKCRLKAEPIKVKIEVAQGEQKKTVL